MTAREEILARLTARPASPSLSAAPESPNWDPPADLVSAFRASCAALGVEVLAEAPALPGVCAADEDGAAVWPGEPLHRTEDPWTAEWGLTLADLGAAETGMIALHPGPGRSRLRSLAPPVHVALLRRSRIVATLADAAAALPEGNAVWICGPSRTADIEGVLVRGVHGPGKLIIVLLED